MCLPVPAEGILELMKPLSEISNRASTIRTASFLPVEQADREVLSFLPQIAGNYEILNRSNTILRRHTADYKRMKETFSDLENEALTLRKRVEQLSRLISKLSEEPDVGQRVWRVISEVHRRKIKQFLHR